MEQEDDRPIKAVENLLKELARLEEIVDSIGSEARAALVYSPESFSYGRDEGLPGGARFGHLAEFRGVYAVLTDLRIDFDVLVTGALDTHKLNRYEAIILPGVECLSEQDSGLLAQWLESGGNLIATADCGARNEYGEAIMNFSGRLLPELAVVEMSTDGAYLQTRDRALQAKLGGAAMVGITGPFWQPIAHSHHADLFLIGPLRNNNPEFAFFESDAPTRGAGKVEIDPGQGRLILVPWHLGAIYHRFGLPAPRLILDHALPRDAVAGRLATSAPLPVEVVLKPVTFGQDEYLLTLINDCTAPGGQRLDTVATGNFAIRIAGIAGKAEVIGGDCLLTQARRSGGLELTVERIGTYAFIHIRPYA